MTTPNIKIKIVRKPTLKVKALVKFPANIVGSNFLTITKANGTYTFGVDYTVLTPGPISDPTTAIIAILDRTASVYKEVSLSSLLTSGLDADLQAIAALTGTGILARTADNTWVLRTITGATNRITVTNGDGVSGAPTIDISASYVGQATITTLGTVATGIWQATKINLVYGGTNADLSATGGAGQYLKQVATGAAVTVGTIPASDIASGAALTKTDDINVTLTLGGTPTTALLKSSSITIGWTGTLAASRGGFGADISAQSGVPLFATGVATFTSTSGTGNFVRVTSPTLVTPALGTPSSAVLTNATGLPLSGLTTQGAYTIVANNTGSAAVPTAMDVSAITAKASPVSADIVLIQDSAASNAFKRTTVGALASAGSVSSINGQTGAVVSYFQPQGRLTLLSLTPVMTATQSAKTVMIYTPYHGNMVPLYDGINMIPTVVAEITVATTDTTKNPAAIGANKVNDWFVWNDAGTIRLSHGPDWTSDTARSAGTALVMVNGILLNNASITNGPAASRGTYVGTTRSNGTSTLDYIFGSAASGGSAAFFGVWNAYNRVSTATTVTDNGVTYTYTSVTIRQARASAGNQITFIAGLVEDGISAAAGQIISTVALATAGGSFGVGLNSTTTYAFQRTAVTTPTANTITIGGTSAGVTYPALGVNIVSLNENSDGTNANTFNVQGTASIGAIIRN